MTRVHSHQSGPSVETGGGGVLEGRLWVLSVPTGGRGPCGPVYDGWTQAPERLRSRPARLVSYERQRPRPRVHRRVPFPTAPPSGRVARVVSGGPLSRPGRGGGRLWGGPVSGTTGTGSGGLGPRPRTVPYTGLTSESPVHKVGPGRTFSTGRDGDRSHTTFGKEVPESLETLTVLL